MKKFISMLLVVICIIASVGCSNGSKQADKSNDDTKKVEANKTEDKTEKKAEVKEEKKEKPVEIVFLSGAEIVEEFDGIAKINEKYNADFNIMYVDPKRSMELLGVKIASNEVPDVFGLEGDTSIQTFIKQGVAAEITDEMFAKIPNYVETNKVFNQDGNLYVDVMYDGKIYGLKRCNLTGEYPTILMWNKKWLKNVGINKIPTTIDEFEEAMYKFAKEDPDQNGVNDTYGFSATTMNAVFGAYGPVPLKEYRGKGRQKCFMYEKDDVVDFSVTSPAMKDALAKLSKWYKDGIISPEFITGENTGGSWALSQAFINHKIGVTGMIMSYHWMPPLTDNPNDKGGGCYREYKKVHPDAVFGEDIEIGPAIEGPEGYAGTHTWGGRGGKMVISTDAAADERKIDVLLNLINDNAGDQEQGLLLSRGVEGVHYNIDEYGNYVSVPDKNKDVGINTFSIGVDASLIKVTNPNMMKFMDKYKSKGYADGIYPTVDANQKYNNDLNRLALESYISIITGDKDVDYFDEFVKEFNKSGGDEIRKDVNDEYKKIIGK